MVTIMIARAGSLDIVREIARQHRTDLRNLRDRAARRDPRWRSVEMVGQMEVDALAPCDIGLLPPLRKRVIEILPAFSPSSGGSTYDQAVVWVLHVHLACHAPLLSGNDLLEAFQRQWPGPPERVDVRRFVEGDAGENAGAIIAYASKHEMQLALKDEFDICWPMPTQAAYWGWLHGLRNGLAPLRVRIGPVGGRFRADAISG